MHDLTNLLVNHQKATLLFYDASLYVCFWALLIGFNETYLPNSTQARSQVFSWGGGGGLLASEASKAAAQRAERASCGRGLEAQRNRVF